MKNPLCVLIGMMEIWTLYVTVIFPFLQTFFMNMRIFSRIDCDYVSNENDLFGYHQEWIIAADAVVALPFEIVLDVAVACTAAPIAVARSNLLSTDTPFEFGADFALEFDSGNFVEAVEARETMTVNFVFH